MKPKRTDKTRPYSSRWVSFMIRHEGTVRTKQLGPGALARVRRDKRIKIISIEK